MFDLFVGHVFADSGVQFVEDSELDFGFLVDVDELGGLYGAFEGRGDDGEVVTLLWVGDELVHDLGKDAGVLHAFLAEVGVAADSVIQIELRLAMTGQINISVR